MDQTSRFWSKVDLRGPDECWEWRAARYWDGYGVFRFEGRNHRAHRVAYELVVGPIPEGLTIDHLCRNRGCVNPAHLEPVTKRENLLRGETVPAAHIVKTHCPKGHLYDEENTYRWRGQRHCRACARERNRAAA